MSSYKINPRTKFYENTENKIIFSFSQNFWHTRYYDKNENCLVGHSLLYQKLFYSPNKEKITLKEAKQFAFCLNSILPNLDNFNELKTFFSNQENCKVFLLKIKEYYIQNYNYKNSDFIKKIKV